MPPIRPPIRPLRKLPRVPSRDGGVPPLWDLLCAGAPGIDPPAGGRALAPGAPGLPGWPPVVDAALVVTLGWAAPAGLALAGLALLGPGSAGLTPGGLAP